MSGTASIVFTEAMRFGKGERKVNDMDYESLYSTATKALNTQLEITDKLQERIKELEAENKKLSKRKES